MDKHDTLLIVSSSQEDRELLRHALHTRYNLLESGNVRQTELLMKQNAHCIAAVLLDYSAMEDAPKKQDRLTQILSQVPVIVITGKEEPALLHRIFSDGAADVIPLDYEPYAMLHRIERIVDLHLHRQYLQTMVEEQANILRHSNETMVDALSSIIEYRSVESGQHILRIRHFTKILLEEVALCCPEYQLNDTVIAVISSAAALHDVGKIAIPDAILMKPGPLTEGEREIMKSHALTGCEILASVGDMGDPEYMRYAHNICHYHHERWDGKGYPEGLSGEDIPICAQVVGLADVYDALTTKRVYKDAFHFDKATNMILRGDCGVFSPKLLECFKHVTYKFEELARSYADGMSPKTESFDVTLPAPVQEKSSDTMERTRAKYYALVHYINAFLMEVDMSQGLFHIIYNPYPELARVQDVNTFADLVKLVLEELAAPQERERMEQFLFRDIQTFLEEDLRRVSYRFLLRGRSLWEPELVEVTLLRINPIDAARQTLAVLCRKVEQNAVGTRAKADPILSDSTLCCRNDEDFTMISLGESVHLLAGYSREELASLFGNKLVNMVLPEDREKMRSDFREQLQQGTSVETEFRVLHKSGRRIWVRDRSRLVVGADGREYINAFLTDSTREHRAYDELYDKFQRYEIILSQTENVLFEWDMVRDSVTFSETWEKIFGFQPGDDRLSNFLSGGSYFHPDDLPLLIDGISSLKNGSHYEMVEVRIATAKGRYIWCRIRSSAVRGEDGKLQKVVGIIINIDAEKQAERVLQDRAERDSLTKLLNKNAARKQAEDYLSRFPQGVSCALLIIDLDDFKQVNDQYGHLFGDAVLTKTAREIEKLFRAQDIVARIGGDEFMVLMRGVADRQLLENRCSRLLQLFRTIFQSFGRKLSIGCSVGIALSPDHGSTYFELFNHADQALYRAKAMGKNCFAFFDGTADRFLPQKPQMQATAVGASIDSDVEPGLADDNIVRYAFQRLYGAADVEAAIHDILALIGRKMNVSRVYVFENSDDNKFCSNTYEWCNEGIRPEIGNLQHISYETDIPGYEDNFNEQGIFYCPDIAVLPQSTYDIVSSQGIKSMLHCAIREGGVFRGYIGFDECVEQRFWTREQIRTLTYFAEMLSVFLLKKRQQEKLSRHAGDLSSILDNQNAWIYIIDPDTCQLKYLNAKTRELAPDVRPGMYCYRELLGREERCPGCPAKNIRRDGTAQAVVENERFGMKAQAEATLIRWQGEESCLLTCRGLGEA